MTQNIHCFRTHFGVFREKFDDEPQNRELNGWFGWNSGVIYYTSTVMATVAAEPYAEMLRMRLFQNKDTKYIVSV